MDKSWMERSRLSKEYDLGVEMFIKFGERHANGSTRIRCPCLKCGNRLPRSSQEIRDHLYIHGIDKSYKTWFWHGEELSNDFLGEEIGDNMDEENKDDVVDKSWMGKSRLSNEYDLGVEMFIKLGERHANGSTSIRCPCTKCKNHKFRSSRDIRYHLYFHGIDQSYTTWFWHGEELSNELKVEEVEVNMEKKDDDSEDIIETDKETDAANPLMSDCNQSNRNTSYIKFDSNKKKTRGATTMREVTRCSSRGDRKVVQYNNHGQPIGVNAVKLKSFIGSCVRFHVTITYATWKHVPNAIKENIFKLIQAGFFIDGQTKKSIFQAAGNSFRNFKSRLTTHYIIPFKDQPHRLENPPDIYSHIESRHWRQFVKSRLNKEFEKKSSAIKKGAQMNKEIEMDNADEEEEYSDRSKGEGGSSKPRADFDTTKSSLEQERMQNKKLNEMVKTLNRPLEKLGEKIRLRQLPPNSEQGNCNEHEQHSEDEALGGPVKNWNLKKSN